MVNYILTCRIEIAKTRVYLTLQAVNDGDYDTAVVLQAFEYWKNELLYPLIKKREENQNRCENAPNRTDKQKNKPYEVEESRKK